MVCRRCQPGQGRVGIELRRARHASTFPQAPLRSRTVGFPEYGSDPGFPLKAFRNTRKLKRWLAYTPLLSRLPAGSSAKTGSSDTRRGPVGDRQVPRAPLPETSVTRFRVVSPTTSKGATPSSSLLRAHAPDHHPPPGFHVSHLYPWSLQVAASPCWVMVLPTFLCKSVPGCLGHDPGGLLSAHACFFPNVIGLPYVPPIGRLSRVDPLRDSTAEGVSRSSPFLTFRPPGLFATQVSPTATAHNRRAAVAFPSEQNLCRYLHRHRIC